MPDVEVGHPFTRPQLEVFLAGLLMQGDGEAVVENVYVKAGEAAADGIRLLQLCHTNGDITIELAKPWPAPCRRAAVRDGISLLLEDGKCWRCGWEPMGHRHEMQSCRCPDKSCPVHINGNP